MGQVTHVLAGLEVLWVEDIADLREAIATQEQDGLTHGLTDWWLHAGGCARCA